MDRIWKYGLERIVGENETKVLENHGKSNVLNDTFNTKAGIGKRTLPKLRALVRQNENITNKDVLQIEKDIEINTRLPNRISLNIIINGVTIGTRRICRTVTTKKRVNHVFKYTHIK